MANPHRGDLAFTAGSQNYTIRYTIDSIVVLEEILGKGIMEIITDLQSWGQDQNKIRLGTIRSMLWAGLRCHHPEIDVKAAGELIKEMENGFGSALAIVGEGMASAFNLGEIAGDVPMKEAVPIAGGNGTASSSTSSVSASTQGPSGTSRLAS